LARAWSGRGKAHWALGCFAEAAADFSHALQLDGDPGANYLNRGQARFYEGRFDAAADDFARAAEQSTDPSQRLHAQVWQGWALRRLGRSLPAPLQAAANGDPGPWPAAALALLAGRMDADTLLAAAGQAPGDAASVALVEAWFSVGQLHLAQGRTAPAREAFAKAREGGITRYAEHAAAGFELQRLERDRR
jgi:lipoprotein NlpI